MNGDKGNIVVSLAVSEQSNCRWLFSDADDFPQTILVGLNGEWFNLGVGMEEVKGK
ncbi:MAG: hypothetical protein IPG99_11660 [Ignavibacteria bacterium]|nr:hypothetical protein [Ignavibacteria bacterium]